VKRLADIVPGYAGLAADHFERLLAAHPRAVCAEPCGAGKTLGVAEYISRHWEQGVLYVAERIEQLEEMYGLLIRLGLEPGRVALYHSRLEATRLADLRRLSGMADYPVVLIPTPGCSATTTPGT
jgi:hypothetical protein